MFARLLAMFVALGCATAVHADDTLWQRLREGGYVVMLRHAQTGPGVGDPPGFTLGDCATQRNLSDAGRADAWRIGEAFRRERVPVAEVRSSEWCRCRDTAALAFGAYAAWTPLNSFFDDRSVESARTREVLALADRMPRGANVVLVTHQVNITAVSGIVPASGEMVILKPAGAGKLEVAGRLGVP